MFTRILSESDAQDYQKLRLSALKTDPEAFGSTFEREAAFSLETVLERVRPTKEKLVLGAFSEKDVLNGIVTLVRETGIKDAHKANVYGMIVSKDKRRTGIGKKLMLDLVDMARGMKGLEQLHLSVVANNEPARKLYESVGFKTYGIEPNALKFEGKYYDEILMVLNLYGDQYKDNQMYLDSEY